MKTIEYHTVDKSAWPRGVWDQEPDKKQWPDPATGLPCIARRHERAGNWCGYVGVPPGHPWHGRNYLTFSDSCQHGDPAHGICHVPEPGEPDNVWWLGFDCHHAFDHAPGFARLVPGLSLPGDVYREIYRDLYYVEAQIAELARQVAAATAA